MTFGGADQFGDARPVAKVRDRRRDFDA